MMHYNLHTDIPFCNIVLRIHRVNLNFFLYPLGKSSKKKRIFYGQADRKRLPTPPPYGQLLVKFFRCFFYLRL